MDANSSSENIAILPGLMCDSRMFGGQIAAFPGAVVVDGFYGGSRSFADMVAYALPRLPERFSLIGHSMGARVALEVIRHAPERVARLALVDTGTHAVREGEDVGRYALRDIGRQQGMAALIDRWLPPMLGAEARQDADLVASLRDMIMDAGLSAYEAQIQALLTRPEVDDLLPAIACPTFVIAGAEDQWSPPAQHEAIARAVPGAQLRIVEHAGHMLPAEKPRQFNAVIREWLTAN